MRAKLYSKKRIKGVDLSFDREISIGRGQENKVVLDKHEVSKKHLRIFFDENQKCFILEDFGSANGTHLDNIRVEGKEPLRHLNVISIAGLYDFIFQDTQLCKARHPGRKQTKVSLKQDPDTVFKKGVLATPPNLTKTKEKPDLDQSKTVVGQGPLSLPEGLGKTQGKSIPDESRTVVGGDAFVLPAEFGKTKEKPGLDQSKTVVGQGPLSLPEGLGKTQGKSILDQSRTVVGGDAFVLPPEFGKTKGKSDLDQSKTVVGQGPFSLPPDLGKTQEKTRADESETVVGEGASILPPDMRKVEDEAETVFPGSMAETVQFNPTEGILPQKLPPARQRFFIEISIDGTRPQRFALKEGENVIGRKAPADIIIEKIEVSRRHAVLTLKTGLVYLEDAGSKNKTFVDGKEITEILEIQPGHALRFGVIKAQLVREHES